MTWWTQRIVTILQTLPTNEISMQKLSEMTAIDLNDIQYVLENFGILRSYTDSNGSVKGFFYAEKNFLEQIIAKIGPLKKQVDRD